MRLRLISAPLLGLPDGLPDCPFCHLVGCLLIYLPLRISHPESNSLNGITLSLPSLPVTAR
ncbi:hypothetical protein M0J40_RS09300 [Providencia rettgeri]|nr:hypothetical protein [Providencia rettgeri]ELR5126660.1 hypothetical protein [Providencia rettgeri]ELR5243846.1 hypothetical protein [Providencia rettgeri]ELS4584851.1 hypothetical protein [Providencia rettgeri]